MMYGREDRKTPPGATSFCSSDLVVRTREMFVIDGEFFAAPAGHHRWRGELFALDVDDRRVRPAQFVHAPICVGINRFCQRQAVITGQRQTDYFFEPRRARCFYVNAFVVL